MMAQMVGWVRGCVGKQSSLLGMEAVGLSCMCVCCLAAHFFGIERRMIKYSILIYHLGWKWKERWEVAC